MMIPFKMSSVVRTQGQAPVKTNKEEEWSSSIQHATHLWCYQWKQLIITVSGWNAPLQKQIEKVTHDFGLRPFNVNPLIPLNNGFPTVLQKIWLGTLKAKVFHVHHMSFHSSLTSTFLKCRVAVLGREISKDFGQIAVRKNAMEAGSAYWCELSRPQPNLGFIWGNLRAPTGVHWGRKITLIHVRYLTQWMLKKRPRHTKVEAFMIASDCLAHLRCRCSRVLLFHACIQKNNHRVSIS